MLYRRHPAALSRTPLLNLGSGLDHVVAGLPHRPLLPPRASTNRSASAAACHSEGRFSARRISLFSAILRAPVIPNPRISRVRPARRGGNLLLPPRMPGPRFQVSLNFMNR